MGREPFIDLGSAHTTTRLSADDSGNLLVNGVALPIPSGIAGSRRSVAQGARSGANIAVQFTSLNQNRSQHTTLAQISDLRLLYEGPTLGELEALSQMLVNASIEYPSGVLTPVTFGGLRQGALDLSGALLSDVAPVDIPAATNFWVRTRSTAPWISTTTLTALSNIGDLTLSLTAQPPVLGYFQVGTGAGAEVVQVKSYSGAGPFIATVTFPMTKAHAAADVFGQGIVLNTTLYLDRNEAWSGSTTSDLTYQGALSGGLNLASTTLAVSSNIGDTFLDLTAAIQGDTLVVDTAGNAETVTVKAMVAAGTFNKRVFLTSPATKAHSSTVAVTGGSNSSGFVPTAIVAERTVGTVPPLVVFTGDSIPNGTGYFSRSATSWATVAFEGNHPYLNISKGAETAQTFAVYANSRIRRSVLNLGGWLLCAYGVNDLYAARTAVQLEADITTILQAAKARGMKCAVCTVTPETTSSDGFLTTGNQTPVSVPFNAQRVLYNAWVRAGAGGLADLVIDTADTIESARDSGLWRIASAGCPYTQDGTHPTRIGHEAMAAAINPSLFVW